MAGSNNEKKEKLSTVILNEKNDLYTNSNKKRKKKSKQRNNDECSIDEIKMNSEFNENKKLKKSLDTPSDNHIKSTENNELVNTTISENNSVKKKKKKKRKRSESEERRHKEKKAEKKALKKKKSSIVSDGNDLIVKNDILNNKDDSNNDVHVSEIKKDNEVSIEHPLIASNFSNIKFSKSMKLAFKNFETPTPIQKHSWPYLLNGRDMIGIAATGSGKTLGFAIPGMINLLGNKTYGKSPRMVVLAPTRELARQIHEVCEEVGRPCGLKSLCVYGGVSKYEQIKALKRRVDIVIGTPGRLLDLAQNGPLDLSHCSYVVLDEADRMLDMGFEKDVRTMFSLTPNIRQTLLYSATWPIEIQTLGHSFLKNPIKVTIGSEDLSASHSVEQIVEIISPRQKDRRIVELLEKYHQSRKNRVIIFILYKKDAPRLERELNRKGWRCVGIHGDKTQEQRQIALEQFKTGQIPLLIATDVAARGLDIPNVEYVLNYSFPLTVEDYVHRIGRTGRAGKTGLAHTFFTREYDSKLGGALCNVLKESNQYVPPELESFGPTITKKKEHSLYGHHFRSNDSRPMKKRSHVKFS